jgi:hypothetical protein|tara:strand:+ start:1786 stop:2040 length:255 start_codon:yes stop_codon:yes gene_type:complete
MKKQTRSILQEISSVVPSTDMNNVVEIRANHVISSAINVSKMIYESYDEATADDLVKRFINSIKTQDPKKFERGIKKLNESNES